MITEQLGPRVATTSPKPTRRRLRRKRRCEIGSLIIEPATRSGIREPARITIQENMLLATGKAQRFPIHAAIAAASPAETEADLAASPHGGTVMDVGARRYRSAATPRTNSLRRRCNSPSMAARCGLPQSRHAAAKSRRCGRSCLREPSHARMARDCARNREG